MKILVITVLAVLLPLISGRYTAAWNISDTLPIPVQHTRQGSVTLANCKLVTHDVCPDADVTFFLYTRSHPDVPEPVIWGPEPNVTNLLDTAFNHTHPVKIIIHGYNSDMNLAALVEIKRQYLLENVYNVFAVDWSPLVMSPCYLAALWNIRHAGKCTAQLVDRIRELGVDDIHIVGFSLGAHVPNYVAINLRPYKVTRITGLDPAMPGFITVSNDQKLDKGDAQFVDVVHTNAFMQGQFIDSGHVDFYMNGGIIQPGCWAETRFFACNHNRAPQYFAESINTPIGFWGWPCTSYMEYLLGHCPPNEPQKEMGQHVNSSASGVYLAITNSVSPFAVGKYTGPVIETVLKSEKERRHIMQYFKPAIRDFLNGDAVLDELYSDLNLQYMLDEELVPFVDLV